MALELEGDFRKDYDWKNVVDPITDDELKTWIANLRSGDYLQGEAALKVLTYSYTTPSGNDAERKYVKPHHCCLGVLQDQCSLTVPEGIETILDENFSPMKLPSFLQDDLASLNDSGKTFNYIARVLERGFKLNEKKE